MKKIILLTILLLFFSSFYADISTTLLMTKVAPVGDLEFSEDWLELKNISSSNIQINDTYTLEINGKNITLLNAQSGTTPITVAPNDIIILHFTYGKNDQNINDNNPGYWDIYLGNEYSLSSQYEIISLKNGATYIDSVWYKTADTNYSDTTLENQLVANDQWNTITDTVYYYVGKGIARMSFTDHNNSFDWKNVDLDSLKPGYDINDDIAIEDVKLYQNYPNPFISTESNYTNIKFYLPKKEKITLKIYTVSGNIIKTLISDKDYDEGFHIVQWDGLNDEGNEIQAGNYFISLKFGKKVKIKKFTYIK